jgi:hypothetical protein
MEPGQSCAYNQTRECFLGLHVVAGDFSLASFQEWMATLKPNSGAGMWMIPFRGIAATDVSVPLDLLYLDEDSRVLDVVEFFPTFRVSLSSPPAASVLALPAHSIFSSQTQACDQLMLCPADEMEWRLERLARTGTLAGASYSIYPRPALGPVLVRDEPVEQVRPVLARDLPECVADPPVLAPMLAVETQAAALVAVVPEEPAQQPAQPKVANSEAANVQKASNPQPARPWMDPSRQPARSSLGWLGKLLHPEPGDPRAKARRSIEGLVAYFFTGGAPQAHEVRDISPTGLYVVTTERWYPGTVIRMTLSLPGSEGHPSERSITIHAHAVRWGNDGVGLEFVLAARGKSNRNQPSRVEPVDSQGLDHFLKRHDTGKKQGAPDLRGSL